jgi:hypothetical protein
MNRLQAVLDSMEIYHQTYPEDACILVTDLEKVIGYLPGKQIDIKVPVGTPNDNFSGTASSQALISGKKQQKECGAELFGLAYISTAIPVIEENKVVGMVAAIVSNRRLDTLRKGTTELSATVEEMTATTEQVAKASDEVSKHLLKVSTQSQEMLQNIKKIDSILKFVQDVANQSHLLGLNAAIEAARAREHGRGFEVVANEIRKMATNSKDAAVKIQDQLEHIQQAVKIVDSSIQQIAAFTEEHAASMQELNSAFTHVAKTTEELSNID